MFDIIIPTYKTPLNLLRKCLESVKQQTFKDYTVWICDGTPHDWIRYDDMLEVFSKYPQFNIIKQTGTGVSQARNQIIRLGDNPYVAFLDSDDVWNLEHLMNMKNSIEKDGEEIGVWFSMIQQFQTDNQLIDLKTIGLDKEVGLNIQATGSLQCYQIINFIPHKYHPIFHSSAVIWFSALVVKRNVLEKTNLFDEELSLGEDTCLLVDILLQGYGSRYLHYHGAFRICHPQQLSNNMTSEQLDVVTDSINKRFPTNRLDTIKKSKDLTNSQKETLIVNLEYGKDLGCTKLDSTNIVSIISKEEYEIESL